MPVVVPPYTKRAKLRDRRIQRDALRPFWTALAKREMAPVDIVCIGDSLTEGARVSDIEKRWVARLRDKLRARYPTAGVTGGQGYISANYNVIGDAVTAQQNQVFTQTGGSTDPGFLFGLGRRYRILSASGHKLNVTVACSSFDVLVTSGSGRGVMGISVDGGAVANHDTSNAFPWSGRWFNSGSQATGEHDIEITWVSGGNVEVEGIMVYDGDETKGIRLWEGGHGGAQTDFYNGGFWITSPGGHGVFQNIQPDLVVIGLGLNDFIFNTGADWPSAAVKTNIDTLIAAVNAACTVDPSILLVIPYQLTGVAVEPWENYVDALWAVAQANPLIAVIDFTDLIGTVTAASGLFDADLIHLNDVGGEFWANAIANALEP